MDNYRHIVKHSPSKLCAKFDGNLLSTFTVIVKTIGFVFRTLCTSVNNFLLL